MTNKTETNLSGPVSHSYEIALQRQYYRDTAQSYDNQHLGADDSHSFALAIFLSTIDHFKFGSVLDLGSGTGRVLEYIQKNRANVDVIGVEPVDELRRAGHAKGIDPRQLIEGDASSLNFADGSIDVVCSFALLHHVRDPALVISEMLRVARKAIFISDSNNFGQGSWWARCVKQAINAIGLWSLANYVKTVGKGYLISEGDGLSYSYSVFNNFSQIKRSCKTIHIINTDTAGLNPYRTAPTVALIGLKHGNDDHG